MERKTTKGRQKIPIKKIERESDRFATFSKRRLGLLRKASEISILCNVDIGLIIYSPTGKPFSFFHPTMESVIGRVQNPNRRSNDASRLLEAYTRTRVFQLNQMLEKLGKQLEGELERERQLEDAKNEIGYSSGQDWWDKPIEMFNMEQVKWLTGWMENMQSELIKHCAKES